MVEARKKADEAIEAMKKLERELDQEDEDQDPWEQELGMGPVPWNAPGKDEPE